MVTVMPKSLISLAVASEVPLRWYSVSLQKDLTQLSNWSDTWEMCLSMPKYKTLNIRTLKGPSQPHLCFYLHARIWLLYFIRSLSKRRKITVELLEIIKHTFWNTAYSKTIRIRFTMLYQ